MSNTLLNEDKMKNRIKTTGMGKASTLAVLILLSAGCDKNFLERLPLTEISEANVWSDPDLTRAFVSKMYEQMDHGYKEIMIASLSDEARFIHDYGTSRIVEGNVDPDASRVFDARMGHSWEDFYTVIRNANMFFERIGQVPFANAADKDQITGEVHFMRAWNYFSLLRVYGGVPIISGTFGLDDSEAIGQVKRAGYGQTVDFILEDIEKAVPLLGEQADVPRGIVHKSAAKALKSRLLLYAASDLYNRPGNTNELVGYVNASPADRTARWTAARNAAKEVIDDGKHGLYAPTGNPREDYANIFLDKGNNEVIFSKLFDKELLRTRIDIYNGPNGYNNWGGNVPLQNLVDAYQMADGSAFDWNNAAHKADPYLGRDPRFYASILYNGAPWKKRGSNGIGQDPVGLIQTARYEFWTGTEKVDREGLDTRKGPIENWNGTYSGYYMRKFMDITLDAQFSGGDQDFVHFRYAEILLNHAEACIALGEEAAARASLKLVRERAGMPGADVDNASGNALRDLCRYERRVEMAFEGHRYFDARRWMTAEVDFKENARGIEIVGTLQVPNDNSTLEYTYTVVDIQPRDFPEKMYFMPIPASEIRANGNLVQNPGYY